MNQTYNAAININDNAWAISTLQYDKKIMHNMLAVQLYYQATFLK